MYEVGDLVWVRNGEGDSFTKLDPLWTGPCEILSKEGNTGRYDVAMPQGTEAVHLERFKPYLKPLQGNSIPFLYFKPQKKLPESDTYTVEKIIAHRIKKDPISRIYINGESDGRVMKVRKIHGNQHPNLLDISKTIGRDGIKIIEFPWI